MDRAWLVKRGEKQVGPFTSADLVKLAESGRILKTDFVRKDGDGTDNWRPAGDIRGLFASTAVANPPPLPTPSAATSINESGGDGTGGMIPYKNPKALIAYYTGLFLSPCCIVGLPLGAVPLVFGILGLRDRKRNPAIKGSAHAWIGIVFGGLSVIMTVVVWVAYGLMLANSR